LHGDGKLPGLAKLLSQHNDMQDQIFSNMLTLPARMAASPGLLKGIKR
jgi:hypothetical protein